VYVLHNSVVVVATNVGVRRNRSYGSLAPHREVLAPTNLVEH
jgi:hypothetical protein